MNPIDRPILVTVCIVLLFVAVIVAIWLVGYFARRRFLRQIASLDPKPTPCVECGGTIGEDGHCVACKYINYCWHCKNTGYCPCVSLDFMRHPCCDCQ